MLTLVKLSKLKNSSKIHLITLGIEPHIPASHNYQSKSMERVKHGKGSDNHEMTLRVVTSSTTKTHAHPWTKEIDYPWKLKKLRISTLLSNSVSQVVFSTRWSFHTFIEVIIPIQYSYRLLLNSQIQVQFHHVSLNHMGTIKMKFLLQEHMK